MPRMTRWSCWTVCSSVHRGNTESGASTLIAHCQLTRAALRGKIRRKITRLSAGGTGELSSGWSPGSQSQLYALLLGYVLVKQRVKLAIATSSVQQQHLVSLAEHSSKHSSRRIFAFAVKSSNVPPTRALPRRGTAASRSSPHNAGD